MINKKLLISAIVSLLCVFALHFLALSLFLYWKYWWYDNLVHLLGGFTIATIVLFYAERFSYLKQAQKIKFLFIALVSALVASIFWEVFEYQAGITYVAKNYNLDTLTDVIVGFVGALVGGVYTYSIRQKNE